MSVAVPIDLGKIDVVPQHALKKSPQLTKRRVAIGAVLTLFALVSLLVADVWLIAPRQGDTDAHELEIFLDRVRG